MNGFYNLTPLKLLLMSATHNVRTALDSKLDKWEKYLERFEAQISETKEEAITKLNETKFKFIATVDSTKVEIDKIPDLAKDKKEQLSKLLDELKAKLDVKTGEAKDKFIVQRDEIKKAIAEFEEKAKSVIGEKYHTAIEEFGKVGNSLHAHLDTLESQYEVERKKKTEQFDEKKTDLTEKVKKWKSVVHEQRAKGMDKLDVFEKEFMDGMQGVNSAFKNLFH